MMHSKSAFIGLVAAMFVLACSSETPFEGSDTPQGKADQISGRDDPSGLLANAERRLAQLVTADDVDTTFGVDDNKVPYPDTYWPMVDNGIAVEWLEQTGEECEEFNDCRRPQMSPLEKFMNKGTGVYSLCRLATKRAKQLNMGEEPLVHVNTNKVTVMAIEEIIQGKVGFEESPA